MRLTAENVPHLSTLHDMTNAFNSMSHESLVAVVHERARVCDVELIKQRVQCSAMRIGPDQNWSRKVAEARGEPEF